MDYSIAIESRISCISSSDKSKKERVISNINGQGFNIGWILLLISVIVVVWCIKYVTNEEAE